MECKSFIQQDELLEHEKQPGICSLGSTGRNVQAAIHTPWQHREKNPLARLTFMGQGIRFAAN